MAGAEIAIIAVRTSRLQELAAEGSGAAAAALRLRGQPEQFLATVQIGITLVSATAGAFGGATFADDLAHGLARFDAVAPYAHELSLLAVIVLVSYLSLVLGELVPKSIALKHPERYSLLIGRALVGLSIITRPLVWLLTGSSNLVLRLVGDQTSFTEARLSPDELRQMVEEAAQAGTVDPRASAIASRALTFPTLRAVDVMVPRPYVISISRSISREQLRQTLLEQNHSRFPVYERSPEHIVGYISTKDVLALAWEDRLIVLDDLLRPPIFVPASAAAVDLLSDMRRQRRPFAIVVDEHGALLGIVTLEDLLEELVGEIFSEHKPDAPAAFRREADGSITALGTTAIRELNQELGLDLPEGDWNTVAGLVMALTMHVPSAGERVALEQGWEIEIMEASPRRVHSVRLWRRENKRSHT